MGGERFPCLLLLAGRRSGGQSHNLLLLHVNGRKEYGAYGERRAFRRGVASLVGGVRFVHGIIASFYG
jgi:hypothetical protein